jgi:uncharacterized protein (TIGR03437 family)
MTALRALLALAALAAASDLAAYERIKHGSVPLTRDGSVFMFAGPSVVAGLKNADGDVVITPESDPVAALRAATETWNAVAGSTVSFHFGTTATETAVDAGDRVNVFSFVDDEYTRSMTDSSIAVTLVVSETGAIIRDTDILFNPTLRFSTTPTLDCFDIQSIATHELGHTIGADHSYLTSATMFAFSDRETVWQRQLSVDDKAFAVAAFPKDFSSFGAVTGKVAYASGTPIAAALVLMVDPSSGAAVGVTTGTDGTYAAHGLAPGKWLLYAYPVAPVMGGDTSSDDPYAVPDWQPVFYGTGAPQLLTVSGGATANVDLSVPTGSATLVVQDVYVGDSTSYSPWLPSLQSTEIFVTAKGLPETVLPEDILIYGPGITVEADSITALPGLSADRAGYLWFTLNVPDHTAWSETALALSIDGRVAPVGSFRVQPSGPQFQPSGVVSGASFSTGSLAPGEIVSLFGTGIGPAEPVQGAFDATGRLQTGVGGVSVQFDGHAAPLFYVSSGQINAQVPFEVSGRSSTLVRVAYQNHTAEAILPVAAARPEIFGTWDRVCVYDDKGTANDFEHPAARGSVIVAYGTGQGVTVPALATGAPAAGDPLNRVKVTATIGGIAAQVEFAGLTPGLVGLLQLNIKVPPDAPTGWTKLEIACNGVKNYMPVYIVVG